MQESAPVAEYRNAEIGYILQLPEDLVVRSFPSGEVHYLFLLSKDKARRANTLAEANSLARVQGQERHQRLASELPGKTTNDAGLAYFLYPSSTPEGSTSEWKLTIPLEDWTLSFDFAASDSSLARWIADRASRIAPRP